MAMNIQQVEKFEILPSNQPANNTYSFKQGNPIITFDLGSTNKLLKASSLRINGELTILDAAGNVAGNNNLNQRRGAAAPSNQAVQFNSRVGINGIFQNVNISSNDTKQTLESIRQYGRMCATILPTTHSSEDFISQSGVCELNTGVDAATGNLNNNTISFSQRLFCGIVNGGNTIPLGVNGVRGLSFSLEMVSDQMLLFGTNAADNSGASYQVKNLSMTGDLLVPDSQGQQKLGVPGNGAFQYNSYNNLYSVIDAGDATQTYNLAQSNVLNVFHNFLPVSYANNYSQDSFQTELPQLTNAAGTTYDTPASINKVAFSRGGMKLGLDYDIDVADQAANGRPQTGLMINALNSIKKYKNITHTTEQPLLLNYGGRDEVIYNSSGVQAFSAVDNGKRNFSIGLALDNVSQVGVDFKGQSYATRIQSNLDGKSPNAVYTYVLSKNTLAYSPQGIQVVS
tara:strand:+ start:7333 stop:8697 length:1365 start_codon:yes stop_codon:yes gene_type:complete